MTNIGPFTEESQEAASRALYELSRGQSWPGVLDGVAAVHVGTNIAAKVALSAAVGGLPPDRVHAAAASAVFACLPFLPLEGSHTRGYRVSDKVSTRVLAEPAEWASAAHAIAELHAALFPTEGKDEK